MLKLIKFRGVSTSSLCRKSNRGTLHHCQALIVAVISRSAIVIAYGTRFSDPLQSLSTTRVPVGLPLSVSVSDSTPSILLSDIGSAVLSDGFGKRFLWKSQTLLSIYNRDLSKPSPFLPRSHRFEWLNF